MIDVKQIPFSKEAIEQIESAVINYQNSDGIDFAIDMWMSSLFIVAVTQRTIPFNKMLKPERLCEIAEEILKGIVPEGFRFHVQPYYKFDWRLTL